MNIVIILLVSITLLILFKQFIWNEPFTSVLKESNTENEKLLLDEYNMFKRINLTDTQLIPYKAHGDYAIMHKDGVNKLIYKTDLQGNLEKDSNGNYILKDSITHKYDYLNDKLQDLRDKTENLSKRIHPKFKFPNTFRIKKYDSNDYLTLKLDKEEGKFNILLNNGNCLNMAKMNMFKISECISDEETDRANQQFTLHYIFSHSDYEKHVLKHNRFPDDISNLDYPIIIIKNRYNNCVGYEKDKITDKLKLSIGPCKYDYKQMWRL